MVCSYSSHSKVVLNRETYPRYHLMNDTLLPRRNQADGRKMWCEVRIDEYRRLYSPGDNRGKCQEETEKELVVSSFASDIGVN